MKITRSEPGVQSDSICESGQPTGQTAASQEVKNQESLVDKVELSTQSKEIKKINDVLEMTPEVRADRVAELKKLVQEGRYRSTAKRLPTKWLTNRSSI